MATLTSKNSYDKIKYTLDLENSIALFTLIEIESVHNNIILVQTMLKRLEDEDVQTIQMRFESRGRKLITFNKVDENGNQKQVKKMVYNKVCYVPRQFNIDQPAVDGHGTHIYNIDINNFMKFYKANIDTIVKRNMIGSHSLVNEPDEEGWIKVRNLKKEENQLKKSVMQEAIKLAKRVRNKLRLDAKQSEKNNENEEQKDENDSDGFEKSPQRIANQYDSELESEDEEAIEDI